jgi:UDP-glucose 4-epimerase
VNLKGLNALVTGSEGFVGRRLVHALHNQGVSVIPLDVKNGVDLTDGKHLNEYLKKTSSIDIVFHLAAIVFVPYSFEHPQITYITNVAGTLNMLELARLRGVKKFVFASSYVYGPPQYLPIDEQHPLHAVSPYNRSKILAEELCHGYYEDYGVSCAILRPFNIYGQGQSKQFLIPQIINQLPSKTIVLQDPTPKRDYVYVDDVVSAYMKAAMYNGTGYDVFNIGSGRSYSVQEVVDKILTLSQGKEVTVTYTHKKREHEIMDIVADIQKAKDKLKWQPTMDIDNGLSKLLKEADL